MNRGRVLKFAANAPLQIPTQFTNVSRLDVALYPITRQEFDANANAPFETWYGFEPITAPVETVRIETNAEPDVYAQKKIQIEPLAAGTYYMKITTPEGVSDAQLILIE